MSKSFCVLRFVFFVCLLACLLECLHDLKNMFLETIRHVRKVMLDLRSKIDHFRQNHWKSDMEIFVPCKALQSGTLHLCLKPFINKAFQTVLISFASGSMSDNA